MALIANEVHTWQPILSGHLRDAACESIEAIAEHLRSSRRGGDAAEPGWPGLAGGTAGIALFFSYLAREFPGKGYEDDAELFLSDALEAAGRISLPPGLYSGFAGVAWVVAHLQRKGLAGAAEVDLGDIDEIIASLVSRSPWPERYELIDGLVGFGVYALERLPDPVAIRCALAIADRLGELAEEGEEGMTWHTPPRFLTDRMKERYPDGWYNLGVAHGVPGISALLAQLVAAGIARPADRTRLAGSIDWILSQRRPAGCPASFPNYVFPGTPASAGRTAWCYGDAGVAATLLLASQATGESAWEEAARSTLAAALARPASDLGVRDAPLCHGAAGVAHILNRAGQYLGDDALLEAARGWYRGALDMRRPGEGIAGHVYLHFNDEGGQEWRAQEGILEGAAGIGLALLGGIGSIEPDWDRMLLTNVSSEPRTPVPTHQF